MAGYIHARRYIDCEVIAELHIMKKKIPITEAKYICLNAD